MRRRHWGWSNEDDPIGEGAAEIAKHLGFGSAELEEPAPLRVDHDRALHAHGASYLDVVRALRGELPHLPDAIERPGDETELLRALERADAENLSVTPYGGGTSVVGGVDPVPGPRHDGAMTLDLSRLDRVLEVDPVSRAARIQAGATGPQIERQLAEHGMTLRFFPQSFERSTLGGWIATRAGGHFATLGTHIDDFVESVRALTPRGVWESRRLPGSGAGPSPDRMLIGSEGILGVITEAWVRVRERPRFRASAGVTFGSFEAGADAVRALAQSELYPSNCRLLDPGEAALTGAAPEGRALLVLGFESADHPLDAWMARAVELCRDHGGELPVEPSVGERAEAAETWRDAFLQMPYLRDTFVAGGVLAETFETAITWDRLVAFVEGVRECTVEALGVGRVACRLTHAYPDGAAPYFTVLAPARRGAELEQWDEVKAAASEAILAAGGTITHHHAVGRDHRPWYDRQRPEPFAAALRAAKGAVDPAGILNPGVLIDPA
jgi:alkyldihydroxyacetonephosphate synthase